MPGVNDDDTMLRALVQLTETQNQRIEGLRQVIVGLQQQLQARADMAVLLAHEVRTPLTVVTGALQAVQVDLEPELRDDLLRRALAQAEHLAQVVDDLLEPPAADGGMHFPRARLREVRTADLVRQALDAVESRLPRDRVALDVDDVTVATAPSRVVAILVNLLGNAAKYGGTGPVELTLRFTAANDVDVEVADRGPGLGGVDPESLFQPFRRGAHASGAPGHGVGLYLVRGLARSLGGDAGIAERPGGGTVASFWFPQRRADDPAAALRAPAAARD